jgi:hypothetical protein
MSDETEEPTVKPARPATTTSVAKAFPQGLVIDGHSVHTAEEMLMALQQCDQTDVYSLAVDCFEKLSDHHDQVEDAVCKLYEFVDNGKLWEGREDHEDFQQRWNKAIAIQRKRQDDKRYIDKVSQKAIKNWGPTDTARLFNHILTRSLAEQASKLISTGLTFPEIRNAINNETVKRLQRTGRGIRRTKQMTQIDISNASRVQNKDPLSQEDISAVGLQIDQDGFCCAYGEGSDLPTITAKEDEPSPVDTDVEMTDADQMSDASDSTLTEMDTPSAPSAFSDEGSQDEYPANLASSDDDDYDSSFNSSPSECDCYNTKGFMRACLHIKKEAADANTRRLACLRKIGRSLYGTVGITPDTICIDHARKLFEVLEMRSYSKNHEQMTSRIRYLYTRLGSWDETRIKHARWFTHEKDAILPDSRGFYRFAPTNSAPLIADFEKASVWFSVDTLFRRLYHNAPSTPSSELFATMQKKGSIVIPDFYHWLHTDFDGDHPQGIMPLIHEEFDMYEYHYKPEPGKPRLGWQRNMWHSLIQQLVRQDPAYYMLYVFFRPDHAWRMISYPYYTKNTVPGEQTGFRHIDFNVKDYIETGRGSNILQGSASFTDEDDQNCTELLVGMHVDNKLGQWWSTLSGRGEKITDGFVQRVKSWMWTDQDREAYDTDWEKQICMNGDVRLSFPALPHGSTGPCTIVRRTVLPWFVGIKEDHVTLDTAESGSWADIANAHRELMNAPRTPSGLTSTRMGGPMYPFPGTARFRGDGHISSCLVGAEKWSSRAVHAHLDVLFGQNEQASQRYISDWRNHALRTYAQCYEEMKQAEKSAYGANSFFARKEAGLIAIVSQGSEQ